MHTCSVSIVAVAQGLPELQHVLYPKPTGFATCLAAMRGRGIALHDITVAYKDFRKGQRASDITLMKGVKRFPLFSMLIFETEIAMTFAFPAFVWLPIGRRIPQGSSFPCAPLPSR